MKFWCQLTAWVAGLSLPILAYAQGQKTAQVNLNGKSISLADSSPAFIPGVGDVTTVFSTFNGATGSLLINHWESTSIATMYHAFMVFEEVGALWFVTWFQGEASPRYISAAILRRCAFGGPRLPSFSIGRPMRCSIHCFLSLSPRRRKLPNFRESEPTDPGRSGLTLANGVCRGGGDESAKEKGGLVRPALAVWLV